MLAAILIFLALGVALVYFTIAGAIVPRIELPGASDRFAQLFTVGAIAFFVGCGLSHLHIAAHAFSEPGAVRLHELGFHVLQFVGGTLFIWAAFRFLEIRVEVKKGEDDARLDHLEELASRDPLTSAYNRRYFEEELGRCIARHRREGTPFSVAHMDIDDFKSVNDEHGHTAGDAVLKLFTTRVNEQIRPTDSLVRFGGDEFGLILPDADGSTALAVAERVRKAAAKTPPAGVPPITVSFGVAACPDHGESAEDLVASSDSALYSSKGAGKNRSALAPTPVHA